MAAVAVIVAQTSIAFIPREPPFVFLLSSFCLRLSSLLSSLLSPFVSVCLLWGFFWSSLFEVSFEVIRIPFVVLRDVAFRAAQHLGGCCVLWSLLVRL